MEIDIIVADESHVNYVDEISEVIEDSAKYGAVIVARDAEYLKAKIMEGKAIIALYKNDFVGFCYIESWEDEKFVSTSALVVNKKYQKFGLSIRIKREAFELSRKKFPQAKLFGLTHSCIVIDINTLLGYIPSSYEEITQDAGFWKGCESCRHYNSLLKRERKDCICTAMLYDPSRLNKKSS